MRIIRRRLKGLEFVREGDKHIAEFTVVDFLDSVGAFAVPGRVEVKATEVKGVEEDPRLTILELRKERLPIKIGPYYMRSFKKLSFWDRLAVRWRLFKGTD